MLPCLAGLYDMFFKFILELNIYLQHVLQTIIIFHKNLVWEYLFQNTPPPPFVIEWWPPYFYLKSGDELSILRMTEYIIWPNYIRHVRLAPLLVDNLNSDNLDVHLHDLIRFVWRRCLELSVVRCHRDPWPL